MNPKAYIARAKKLDSNYTNINRRLRDEKFLQTLIHGALGMSGETGEVVDMIKKHMVYDKPLDREKLKLELGDVLWYMAIIMDALDTSFEEVMDMNINKLEVRYANGFSEKAALERKDVK